jgi:hypothetical protein
MISAIIVKNNNGTGREIRSIMYQGLFNQGFFIVTKNKNVHVF